MSELSAAFPGSTRGFHGGREVEPIGAGIRLFRNFFRPYAYAKLRPRKPSGANANEQRDEALVDCVVADWAVHQSDPKQWSW